MWKSEQDAQVRQIVAWAGPQIYAAHKRGYSTAEAMAEAYRVDRGPDPKELEEKRLLNQIQTNVNIQQAKQHGGSDEDRAIGNFAKGAAVSSALGMAFGLGAGAMMVGLTPTINTSHSLS